MKARMKLGLDVRVLSDPMSGVGRYTAALLDSLRRRNIFDVVLFTNTPIRAEYLKHTHGFQVVYAQRKHWRKDLLPQQLSAQKINVYHATWDKGVPFAAGCSRFMTIHDLFCISKNNKYLPFLKKLRRRFELRRETKACNKIFTVSYSVKNDIIKYLRVPEKQIIVTLLDCDRGKIDAVLGSQMDASRFEALTGGSDYFISLVSRLNDKRKNVPFLIKSFGRFIRCDRGSGKDIKLLIVGKFQEQDPQYQGLLKIVQEERLTNSVIFLGYIDDADLFWLLKRSKALVFTSLSEGFGIPILEAFYLGVPVIAGNSCAMAEIAAENSAILVDPTNEEALAEAMAKIAFSCDEAQYLIKQGMRRLKYFDWEKSVDKIIETYEKESNQ
jgi:glycosyltransferase involved in cell wall biosynthesis